MSRSAPTIDVTIADNLSLSPNVCTCFISYVDTVSFSFTIGIAPNLRSSLNVFSAFFLLVSVVTVALVISTCAAIALYSANIF